MKLDFLSREDYDSLHPKLKEIKSEYHIENRAITKLEKRLIKIREESKQLHNDLRLKKKIRQSLFNKIRVINRDFIPTMSITISNKKDKNYCYVMCIIKCGRNQKSIHFSTPQKVVKDLEKFNPKITFNLFKTKPNNFKRLVLNEIEGSIKNLIDFKTPNWSQTKLVYKSILSELERRS